MHITPNNKLASLGTVGLLFLAGIAGMVFLLPVNSAHAATPTVSLSTISSGVQTAATSAKVADTLVITGNGFLGANPIAITTTVGTATVTWLTAATCGSPFASFQNSGTGSANSLTHGGCLTTTAAGTFMVSVAVPALPGGAESIVVTDGTSSVTTPLTVTPAVTFTVTTGNDNFGFPEEGVPATIAVTGFGASESVTISTPMFATTSYTCVTSTVGSCGNAATYTVADTSGGAKTITATGATTGLTQTATYTVNPWVAFYNSQSGQTTTFSFLGSAPTSLLIEAHGLPVGTIASGSITVGGISTNHGSVVIGAAGDMFDVVVSPTSNVPFGLASVVVAGTTFSYAGGNILSVGFTPGVVVTSVATNVWGGALISSIAGTNGAGTGVVTTDASSYKPGSVTTASTTNPSHAQNVIGFFGYGFVPAGTVTVAAPAGATITGTLTKVVDANGAFFLLPSTPAALGETPWSTSGTPTVAATYSPTVTEAATTPANVLSPSFGITPWIDTTKGGIFQGASTSTTVDYSIANLQAKVHGFGSTDTVTITIGGAAMASGGTIATTNGAGTSAAGQVPDLASGKQNVVATGSVSGQSTTATGAVTFDPRVDSSGGVGALSINNGGAGQSTNMRTATAYGVHGLAANTAYNIEWNAISGSSLVGTFTSTSTGGIPVPGKQFTIPSDSSGIHIIDIQAASGTTSAIYGNVKADFTPAESPFSGGYTSQFQDLLFSNIALLSASPSVGTIGSPMAISGTGLSPGGSYVVALSSTLGSVASTAPALQAFTATASGSVPASTSITLTDTATTTETGTVMYFQVQTAAHFGTTTTPDATAQFVLASSASLNMTSAPGGHGVSLSAHALNAGGVYNIIFNYVQSQFTATSFTGTPVGIIAPNAVGAGSATFNVPTNAAAGTYIVQLTVGTAGAGGAVAGTAVLDTPLSLTVGSVSTTSCNTTTCMSASGSPSVTNIGGNKAVQTSFTNTSNAPVTAIVYAVVHNALGQTVSYSTATVSANAGASATAYDVLFGLAPGTYSVSIFATSTSGTAISTTSTVTVTI